MIERCASAVAGMRRWARGGRAAALVVAAGTAGLMGCESDSWLYDPSVIGRWEYTPTIVPILDRIDVIERDQGQFVETTPVMPEDLLPVVSDYEVGPGDVLIIEIWDLIQANTPSQFQRTLDGRGYIDLPQLGRVNILGLTVEQARERLRQLLRERGILEDALVSVEAAQQRQQTFSVFGVVAGVGRYFIPNPDYRLLEALTEAGGISPAITKVFVIRQVPLGDEVRRGAGATPADKPTLPPVAPAGGPQEQGRDLTDLIEQLTEPEKPLPAQPPDGSPGVFGSIAGSAEARRTLAAHQDQAPPIELVDEPAPAQPATASPIAPPETVVSPEDTGRWMFLNGQWVRVTRRMVAPEQTGLPESADGATGPLRAEDLVTQRVIEVPTAPLLQGSAEFNIVIRPGDIIHVPSPDQGVVYLGGPGISRAGTYNLPIVGRLTLTKSVIAAGGLSAVAVPWRCDLTRMVGSNRQATIRLNLQAIYEGTQPDVFLKGDDVVNVGTAFWATPLAVIRNGFRMSYGFGFLLDRNFGNDVFGPPPDDNNFN